MMACGASGRSVTEAGAEPATSVPSLTMMAGMELQEDQLPKRVEKLTLLMRVKNQTLLTLSSLTMMADVEL